MSAIERAQPWDGRPPEDAAQRDGWHWLADDVGVPFPVKWDRRAKWWAAGPFLRPDQMAAEHFGYLGPAVIPGALTSLPLPDRLALLLSGEEGGDGDSLKVWRAMISASEAAHAG